MGDQNKPNEPKLKMVCPFFFGHLMEMSCEEARVMLHEQGYECQFVTKLQRVIPSLVTNAPPTVKMVDMCLFASFQEALNGLTSVVGMMMQLLTGQVQVVKGSPGMPGGNIKKPFGLG